ncbi:hypothetical protein DL95DRAFT_404915 [Leptodontidium sp. 2 PMI_412]|nr:hypothetical protein DL95DRAFT_404915 [Leptodontidium sp. 2 PMI_412]
MPSLMSTEELRAVAHELGHGIHRLLSSHYIYSRSDYMVAWKKSCPGPLPPQKAPIEAFHTVKLAQLPANRMSHFQHMLWQSEFDLRVHSYSEEETETLDLALECQKILIGGREEQLVSGMGFVRALCCFFLLLPSPKFSNISPLFVFRTKEGAREAKGKGGLIRYLIYLVALRMTGRSETTMSALEKFMGRPLSTKAFIDALRAPGKR